MARTSRQTKASKSKAKPKAKSRTLKMVGSKSSTARKAVKGQTSKTPKKSTKSKSGKAPSKANVSRKLLEVIERRKRTKKKEVATPEGGALSLYARPKGRRGRKARFRDDYNSQQNPDESGSAPSTETLYDRIEYDTGIRVSDHKDDMGYNSLDRFEDGEEELNFDI